LNYPIHLLSRNRHTFLLIVLFCLAFWIPVHGQTDSVRVVPEMVPEASILDEDDPALAKRLPNPRKALILSAVLPGAGQFYNKRYWKIPIIYAGAGVLGYFIQTNYGKYVIFRDAFIAKQKYNVFILDRYYPEYSADNSRVNDLEFMRRGRNLYRRWFEQSIILAAALYALNIVDANVDAHLRGFRLGNDRLSLLPAMPDDAPSAGLTLRLTLK
jgi:hypothetical protein